MSGEWVMHDEDGNPLVSPRVVGRDRLAALEAVAEAARAVAADFDDDGDCTRHRLVGECEHCALRDALSRLEQQ